MARTLLSAAFELHSRRTTIHAQHSTGCPRALPEAALPSHLYVILLTERRHRADYTWQRAIPPPSRNRNAAVLSGACIRLGRHAAAELARRVEALLAGKKDPAPERAGGKGPELCQGCPHRKVFEILSKLGCIVAGDIGCYTLGVLPPFEAMDT